MDEAEINDAEEQGARALLDTAGRGKAYARKRKKVAALPNGAMDITERRNQAAIDGGDVLVVLSDRGGMLDLRIMTRQDPPDPASQSVIFASWLNANLGELVGQARDAYLASLEAV